MTETAQSAHPTTREPIQSTATFMPKTDENGQALSDSQQEENKVTVHFNPESLDITFTNSIQKGRRNQPAQVSVTETTAKLSMELIFDTTLSGTDVRTETNRLSRMMDPAQQRPRRRNRNRKIPSIVIFKWGTILFEGYIDSYKETIDFFSSEGVPLRASITMSMTQQQRDFAPNTNVDFDNNVNGDITPGNNAEAARSTGTSRNSPVKSLGIMEFINKAISTGNSLAAGNSSVARSIARANGIENMRLPEVNELVLPDIQSSGNMGLAINNSGAGGETANLFSDLKRPSTSSAGAPVSFSSESHFDMSSLDTGGNSSMSADVGVSADIEPGIQFED